MIELTGLDEVVGHVVVAVEQGGGFGWWVKWSKSKALRSGAEAPKSTATLVRKYIYSHTSNTIVPETGCAQMAAEVVIVEDVDMF